MKRILIGLIRFYRRFISPAFPGKCRFIPTCSEYGLEAIETYGAAKGGWMTFKRLLRCNPFNHGDFYAPVPRCPPGANASTHNTAMRYVGEKNV